MAGALGNNIGVGGPNNLIFSFRTQHSPQTCKRTLWDPCFQTLLNTLQTRNCLIKPWSVQGPLEDIGAALFRNRLLGTFQYKNYRYHNMLTIPTVRYILDIQLIE